MRPHVARLRPGRRRDAAPAVVSILIAAIVGGCGAMAQPATFTPTPTGAPASAGVGPTSIPATAVAVDHPTELAVDGSTIWAISGTELARIDTETGVVTMVNLGSGDELDNLAATPTALWVADFDAAEVLRLDPASGKVLGSTAVGTAEDVLPVGGTIWVTNHHEGSVTRIDAGTAKPIGTVVISQAGTNGPHQIAEGAGSVWIGDGHAHQVIRLDPSTGKTTARITMPSDFDPCGGIAATDTAVWITGCHDSPDMVRIDPATNSVVADIPLGGYGDHPIVVDGAVWEPVGGAGFFHGLVRIDPATNTVDRRLPIAALADVGGSVIAGGEVWVANGVDAVLHLPLTELTTGS
jgi:streptogramin lyase